MPSVVLGVNAFHGDASAVTLVDGAIGTAVEEERFRRVKHWAGLPEHAIRCGLDRDCSGTLEDVAAIAIPRRPQAYLGRKLALALRHPRSLPRALKRVANLRAVTRLSDVLAERFDVAPARMPPVVDVEHHVAHAASAFYCSPYDEAMCLTVDGFGDFVSTMFAVGRGRQIEVLDRVLFPHSLGLFYLAMTQFLGFPTYGDEYKVMGLAAYGEPTFLQPMRRVVRERSRGRFKLDLTFFRHVKEGVDMTWEGGRPEIGVVYSERLADLLGPPREPGSDLTDRHRDLAASAQALYEEHLFRMVRALMERTGLCKLCLAGGCGQNSVANGKLFEQAGVEDVFVQAAAADNGTALGAALHVHHVTHGQPRAFVMEHCYWGPEFDEQAVRSAIGERLTPSNGDDGRRDGFEIRTAASEAELVEETAAAIDAGEVVGWFQGRSEWAPRALGNRSILADPRRDDMRDLLNLKIKRRESFRPFAPSILEERVGAWFTLEHPDPFMIKVYPIRPEQRPRIPAVTHVDGTGRLQSVNREANPRYWALIRAFEERTGIPLVLNTSFNENEPIVNTPDEALDCFLRTNMDRIVLGDVVVRRVASGA